MSMKTPTEPLAPTAAALSRPILALLLASFILNAGSGICLWLWPIHPWRVFHGWTIPLFLITFGIIWGTHVLQGWRLRKNILSGVLTLSVFLGLTVTGWIIHYSGSDIVQKQASNWHTWLGLSVSFLLLAHALLGWRCRESA